MTNTTISSPVDSSSAGIKVGVSAFQIFVNTLTVTQLADLLGFVRQKTERLSRQVDEDYGERCRQAALKAWDMALLEAKGADAASLRARWADYQDLEAPVRLERCMGFEYFKAHVRSVAFANHGQHVLDAALEVWEALSDQIPTSVRAEFVPDGRNPVDALGALEWQLGSAHRSAQRAAEEAIEKSEVVLASKIAAKQAAGRKDAKPVMFVFFAGKRELGRVSGSELAQVDLQGYLPNGPDDEPRSLAAALDYTVPTLVALVIGGLVVNYRVHLPRGVQLRLNRDSIGYLGAELRRVLQ